MRRAATAACVVWIAVLAGRAIAADHGSREPYLGGFVRCFQSGDYGQGEIRSGDLGLAFYGPDFGGPYRARIHVADGPREWSARSVRMAAALEGLWNPAGFCGAGRSQPDNPDSTGLMGEHSDDLLGLPRQLDEERVAQASRVEGRARRRLPG